MSDDSGSHSSSDDEDEVMSSNRALLVDEEVQEVDPISRLFNSTSADLILRATSGKDHTTFHIHRLLLVDLGGGFRDVILAHENLHPGSNEPVDIALNSTILDCLLRFIYPMPSPSLPSLTQWTECYTAAQNYKIPAALSALRAQFTKYIPEAPLRTYALAARFGFHAELDESARKTFGTELVTVDQIPECQSMASCHLIALMKLNTAREATLRKWAANLAPPVPKCSSCDKPHWTQTYIEYVREAITNNPKVEMEELFRTSSLSNVVMRRAYDYCDECPIATSTEMDKNVDKNVDLWFHHAVRELDGMINTLSVRKL